MADYKKTDSGSTANEGCSHASEVSKSETSKHSSVSDPTKGVPKSDNNYDPGGKKSTVKQYE